LTGLEAARREVPRPLCALIGISTVLGATVCADALCLYTSYESPDQDPRLKRGAGGGTGSLQPVNPRSCGVPQ